MKIKIDSKNKAIMADGFVHGKRVHVVSVCKPEDSYDEEFGVRLTLAKFKVAETEAKIKDHERNIKTLQGDIAKIISTIEGEQTAIDLLKKTLETRENNVGYIIGDKYN